MPTLTERFLRLAQLGVTIATFIGLCLGALFTVFTLYRDVAEGKSATQTLNRTVKEYVAQNEVIKSALQEIQAELKYNVRPALLRLEKK